MKEKHWSRSNVEVVQSQVKKGCKSLNIFSTLGKKTDPMAPLIHQSQKLLDGIPSLDPMRRQPVVKFIAKVQGVVTPAWSHRKLQEIEGVLVDLGGANQHFVLL